MIKTTRAVRISAWISAAFLAFVFAVSAGAVSVTISNNASTALCLYDETAGQFVSTNFCGNAAAPVGMVGQGFQLDGTHLYRLIPAGSSTNAGHKFRFIHGSTLIHGGDRNCYAQGNMEFWKVNSTGSYILVRGVPVTFRLVSPAVGLDRESFFINSGSRGTAYSNGVPFQTHLIPADGDFGGVYSNIRFEGSGSSSGTLTLGWKYDIVNWSGAGHRFVWTGSRSIRVTTDKGVVFDIVAGPTFFEAEDMTVSSTNDWQAQTAAADISAGRHLSGTRGGQGTARQTVWIEKPGVYRVWTRHNYYANALGPFRAAVRQNGVEVGHDVFCKEQKKEFGFSNYVWEPLTVSLARGNAEVVFTKVEPLGSNFRQLDCVVVTDDPLYQPNVTDFMDPLYVKVRMQAEQAFPVFLRMDSAGSCLLFRDTVALGAYWGFNPANPSSEALRAGDETVWFNMVPFLAAINSPNTVRVRAQQEYTSMPMGGVSEAHYTIDLARHPTPSAVFKRFKRSGFGCGLTLSINPMEPDRAVSDTEISAESVAKAGPLLQFPVAGKRPAKFPVMTQGGTVSSFFQPGTVNNEMTLMTAMGFNSIGVSGYDPVYYTNGFTKLMGGDPKSDIKMGLVSNIVAWGFVDEPHAVSLTEIITKTNCQEGFRRYLAEEGLAPSFFGKSEWREVMPTTNRAASPREFYYTVKYQGRQFTDLYRPGTAAATDVIPSYRNAASYAEESTFYGNSLAFGIDIFDALGPRNGFMLGWTEDWLNYSVTYQLCGYRAEWLRAACRPCNKPFGMYCLWRSPWDIRAKAACQIGHGSTRIYYYNYGPRYSGIDANPAVETYPALREINHAIGGVEDYLVGAEPVRSRVALLYSHATDAWTLDRAHSEFGKNRMGVYLILTHLGYPVEIVSEDEVAAGKLTGYSMLICDASHLKRKALAPMVSWLEKGGILYVGPGSLGFDEFNAPLGFDEQVSISRAPYALKNEAGYEIYGFPTLPNLAPVHYGDAVLESVCGIQKVIQTGGRVVTNATFEDGSPAAFTKTVGRGKLEFCGFFPGLAYEKGGMVTKLARDARDKEPVTYGSTDYPQAYRTFFAELLAPARYAQPVRTSHYLLEANRLENTNATVITLSNWTADALPGATVSFARNGRGGVPFSIINPIKHRQEKDGVVTLTLDMNTPADFIVVPGATSLRSRR